MKIYQGIIIQAIRGGWRGHDESGQEQWTFAKAFLYSLTVITTIGKLFACFIFEKKKHFIC